MKVALVTVDIKPEHRDRFMEEILLDARGSVENEPGCVRFDVLQDDENPNRVYLYEVYRDEAAEEAHLKMPHFIRWENATKDWFARPMEVINCTSVYPEDSAWD